MDLESVQIIYRPGGIGGGGLGGGKGGGQGGGQGGGSDEMEEYTVEMWSSHFDDLREMYISGGHNENLMLTRLFAMTYRYDAISSDESANQAVS